MADRLLPFNTSELEQTIEQVQATRLDDIPLPLSTLWNPSTCPAHLLPWLAWALSVDTWDSDWPEPIKRAFMTGSIALHRKKGTLAALRQVLNAIDVRFEIKEWFETDSPPHTFQLTIDAVHHYFNGNRLLDAVLFNQIREIVDPVKPVRSHYTTRIKIGAENALGLADKASVFTVVKTVFNFSVDFQSTFSLATTASIVPLVNRWVTPTSGGNTLLNPIVFNAPTRASLRKKVTASLLLTPNLIQSKAVNMTTQSSSSLVMKLSGRVML